MILYNRSHKRTYVVDGHVHRRGIMPLLYSHEYFEMGLSIGVCNAHGYANMVVKFQREGYKIPKGNCCILTTDVVVGHYLRK